MSDTQEYQKLTPTQIANAAAALRWAAFGSTHRGPGFTYRQSSPERLHFETEYEGRKAWVDLDIPFNSVSLLLAGALLIQQLNSYFG